MIDNNRNIIIHPGGSDFIKRCILDLVNLCKQFDKRRLELKNNLGRISYQKEFGLVKVYTARQTGHTTAQFQILREDDNACMLSWNEKTNKRWKKENPDIKDRVFTTYNFNKPCNIMKFQKYKLVLVDCASYNKYVDEIIETCSYIDDCICVLVG